jgi:hypothetical protein
LRFLSKKILGFLSLALLLSIVTVPFIASAAGPGNRVYYSPDASSFNPAAAYGGQIANGGGNGINKLTILGTPDGGYVDFIVRNNNDRANGKTLFEVRKGPGNVDLSSNVLLANNSDYNGAGQTTLVTFASANADAPLYVRVLTPPCAQGGTFRIQAHPGGTVHQGNGPGVVVHLECGQAPPPVCYDYNGNPIPCPTAAYRENL